MQLPSACYYPASGRVVSSGQSTDPATVQRKGSKQEESENILWESQGPILLYTCTWRCLRMVMYRWGWVGEFRRGTMGSEPLVQQDAVGLNVMLFVILIGYCMTTIIQVCFQPRCSLSCTPTGQNTSSAERGLGRNRLHMNT